MTHLHADTVSWNGGTGSWDDTANWSLGALPTSSDTALFGGTAGTVTATAAQSVFGLQFASSGYTLGGNTLTIGTGGIDASTLSSGTTTINSPIFIGNGVQRWNVGAGATLATGALGVGGSATDTYSPLGGIVFIKGTVTTTAANGWGWRGTGGQGLLGPGMVIDNGNGTYDWARAGVGGLISAPSYVAAGTGDKNNVQTTSNTTVNSLNASWASVKVSGSTLTLNGSNLYVDTGIILQNGGSIAGSAPIKANSDGLYLYTPDTGSISSSIQNNGANAKKLYKAGTGTLTLSGNNTYTGATVIHEGTLALGASGSINNTSGVSLGNGGTFDVSAKTGGYTVNNLTGSGTVNGPLTISTQLAIGNSPGTIEFDDLTLGSASSYMFELVGGGTDADLANVSGNLTIGSGALLDLVQLGSYTEGDKFTLFAYQTGNLTGTFSGLADGTEFTDAGGLWKINYFDATPGLNGGTGTSFVTIVAVPEPSAALLGGLGMLALLRRRRS